MNERRGILRNNYVCQLAAYSATGATDIKRNGWLGKADGTMYNLDSPGAVPLTAVVRGGMAFTPDGVLYTTTATPDATTVKYSGMSTRPDGAMHINKTASGPVFEGQQRNDNVWITT